MKVRKIKSVSEADTTVKLKVIHKELYWLAGGIVIVLLIIIASKLNQPPVIVSHPTPVPVVQTSPIPTFDSMLNWKTYTYEKLFFKYPNNWKLETYQKIDILIRPEDLATDKEFPNIGFYTIPNPNNLTVKEYQIEFEKDGPGLDWISTTTETKVVSGIAGYYNKNHGCDPLLCDIFIISFNKNIYVVQLIYPGQVNKDLRKVFDQILSSFKFVESTIIRTTPTGIDPVQIKKEYTFNIIDYALYQKNNMNMPINSSSNISGVLYAGKNDQTWKMFNQIKDADSTSNYPYELSFESGSLFMLVVDRNGAGSGEGIAKLLKLSQNSNKWVTTSCFYYVPERFKTSTSVSDSLSKRTEEYFTSNPDEKYILNNQTQTWESKQLDKQTQSYVINEKPDCSNFEVMQYISTF